MFGTVDLDTFRHDAESFVLRLDELGVTTNESGVSNELRAWILGILISIFCRTATKNTLFQPHLMMIMFKQVKYQTSRVKKEESTEAKKCLLQKGIFLNPCNTLTWVWNFVKRSFESWREVAEDLTSLWIETMFEIPGNRKTVKKLNDDIILLIAADNNIFHYILNELSSADIAKFRKCNEILANVLGSEKFTNSVKSLEYIDKCIFNRMRAVDFPYHQLLEYLPNLISLAQLSAAKDKLPSYESSPISRNMPAYTEAIIKLMQRIFTSSATNDPSGHPASNETFSDIVKTVQTIKYFLDYLKILCEFDYAALIEITRFPMFLDTIVLFLTSFKESDCVEHFCDRAVDTGTITLQNFNPSLKSYLELYQSLCELVSIVLIKSKDDLYRTLNSKFSQASFISFLKLIDKFKNEDVIATVCELLSAIFDFLGSVNDVSQTALSGELKEEMYRVWGCVRSFCCGVDKSEKNIEIVKKGLKLLNAMQVYLQSVDNVVICYREDGTKSL
ncbi:hypothetical protein HK098_007208 [Nowakowskiella sp. JEL0407]|nr:hypothetical protein HK098_007208 [Nowakowskiella sp. JEL0407]